MHFIDNRISFPGIAVVFLCLFFRKRPVITGGWYRVGMGFR